MTAFLHIFGTLAVCALVALTVCIYVNVRQGNQLIMSLKDDLNAAVAAIQQKDDAIVALVGTLNTQIAALQAQVNQNRTQIDPAVVQAAIDALNAESSKIATALSTPVTTDPAPGTPTAPAQ